MKALQLGLLVLLWAAPVVQAQPPDLNAIQQLATRGQVDQALQALDQHIAADPKDVEARFLKGLLLVQQGDKNRAREVFLDLTRRYPRLTEAYTNLAALYAADGEYEPARQALLSAIANTPDYAKARVSLGDLYVKLAADAYKEALELNPTDTTSRARLRLLEQMFETRR